MTLMDLKKLCGIAAVCRNLTLLLAVVAIVAFAVKAHSDTSRLNEETAVIKQETVRMRAEVRTDFAPICGQWDRVRFKGIPTQLSDEQTAQLKRVCR